VINLAGFDPAHKQSSAKAIGKACEEIGFFTITGHGLDPKFLDQMRDATKRYFDRPVLEKKGIVMTEEYPYGYSGFAEENLAAGYGQEQLPDLKESFCIGPYNALAGMPAVQWPQQPADLQKVWLAYYQQMEQLAAKLLRLFAVALKLPEDWFDAKIDRHRSALRALNYPEMKQDPKPGQIRAGAHTDYGSLTILMQDAVGGLQVKTRKGEWQDAPPVPNAFVINLGDLMSRWSNDKWVSTLHRVVNPPSRARRQSIAFFHNINHDQVVSCIPTCTDQKNPPKYKDILAWDLLMEKHLLSVGGKKP
jgi:isopenicillin N synthase-like dioxygenase